MPKDFGKWVAIWAFSIAPVGIIGGGVLAALGYEWLLRALIVSYICAPMALGLLVGLGWLIYHTPGETAAMIIAGVWVFGGFVGVEAAFILAIVLTAFGLAGVLMRWAWPKAS